jgi:hypothetical protein
MKKLKEKSRLSGSILEDKRPIHEAARDHTYAIRLAAVRIADRNYQKLLKNPELRDRFYQMVDSPAKAWEIQWRFGLSENHYWQLILNPQL